MSSKTIIEIIELSFLQNECTTFFLYMYVYIKIPILR